MGDSCLGVMPVYVRSDKELAVTCKAIATWTHSCDAELLVVDDCSPSPELIEKLVGFISQFDHVELELSPSNEGFSATVNVGLRRALEEGRDAVLVNSDIEFIHQGWLEIMQANDAWVVGALLVYPNRLIQHAGIYFCSPPAEQVLTVQEGYVPICDLDPDYHGLVSYARKENRIFRCATKAGRRSEGAGRRQGGYAFELGVQGYTGNMLEVSTSRGTTRITPNHRLTAFWNQRAMAGYGVYLMRRGSHWRIGHSKIKHSQGGFGPRLRMGMNDADALWLLEIVDTKAEAIERESLVAWSYGVPTWQFKLSGTPGITQDRQDYMWAQYDSQIGARELLQNFNLSQQLPLCVRRNNNDPRRANFGSSRRFEIAAANLMPGFMQIPTDPGRGQTAINMDMDVRYGHYQGNVYSIEVPPHHHYVSNGNIVHNSVITRTFDHIYKFAPGNLPAAHEKRLCPVTGALQFIRHECLSTLGLYDEKFRMGWEDVDFCTQVFAHGERCVYEPHAVAIHHESLFRGRNKNKKIHEWEADSWEYLHKKHAGLDFSAWCPTMLDDGAME